MTPSTSDGRSTAFRPRLMSIEARSKADGTPLGLSVRPNADGIDDFTYTNFNDWANVAAGGCAATS